LRTINPLKNFKRVVVYRLIIAFIGLLYMNND
jgi:hypothetical protein